MRSASVPARAGNAPCSDKLLKSVNTLADALEDRRQADARMRLQFLLPKQPVDALPACISHA
jgi:hypothetical protein